MALSPSVTRTGVRWASGRRRLTQLASTLLIVLVIAASSSAQVESSSQPERHDAEPSLETSQASLDRIRTALQIERRVGLAGESRFDGNDAPWRLSPRPASRILPELDIRGGVDLIGDADRIIAPVPVPLGGATHQDLMNYMTPRALNEATTADDLGILTAAPLAFLLPHALKGLKAIGGWFSGDDTSSPEFPMLSASAAEDATTAALAESLVLEANVQQRGRTVVLSLVVAADTPPDTARALGQRFVGLVKTAAPAEPNPSDEIGAGEFDYIIHISSPTDGLIARGRKTTVETQLRW